MLESARAEALFVSTIQRSDPYSATAVREAIRGSVRRHGTRGCAGLVAHEYGEHPESAVGRMCWALDTVRGAFPAGSVPPPAMIITTSRKRRPQLVAESTTSG